MQSYIRSMTDSRADFLTLYFEDIYREDRSRLDRLHLVNTILKFLNFWRVTEEAFGIHWESHFDPAENRWASPDLPAET